MALVLFEKFANHTGKITLNDPANLNAMGEEMAAEFSALVEELRPQAHALRALVITGAGRAFSAGGNLEMLERKQQLSGEENRLRMLKFYHSFLGILSLNIPLIGSINGHAIGAGLCVAAACDIRIASDQAKFGVTFTKLGLHPGMGGTFFLPRILGIASAAELMLTGRVVDAAEALRIGLVSRVVPSSDLAAATDTLAGEVASCGPESVRQVLSTLRAGSVSLAAALEHEALCQSINYRSGEFKEGVRAAIEKRKANFS